MILNPLALPGRRIFGGRSIFQVSKRMIAMTNNLKAIAAATLLLAALNVPCRAEDAPATPPAAAQATPGDSKATPADVPRPSIKSTDTAAPDAASEPAPRHRRHYAHRYYRYYAYREPFPIFFPHLYHNRIVWNRVSWFRQ
jgi:hypothetical protein